MPDLTDDEFAPFRSRRGSVIALVLGAVTIVLFVLIGVFLGDVDPVKWTPPNRLFMVMIGLGVGGSLWRWALIKAVPDLDGITVRNLIESRHIAWQDIREVTFDAGEPWLTLHLVDTEAVAVMAIQRADGQLGQNEARRLARLVSQSRSRQRPKDSSAELT